MSSHGASPTPETTARFSVALPGSESVQDILGLWEPAAVMPAASAFSLDTLTASPVDAITWRVDLPADPALAARATVDRTHQFQVARTALERVDGRLDTFLRQHAPTGGMSFAPDTPAPERSLGELLLVAAQPASFATGSDQRAELDSATQAAQDFLAQVQRLISAYAWIETAAGDLVIGRTRVGWTGDFATVWTAHSGTTASARHAETVTLALATRALWVRFAGHVLTGALRVGRWLALPGGPVVALPAIWRFINEIVDEYRHIKQNAAP